MPKFMKTRPVGAELFHADGRTEGLDEANWHFSHFYGSAYIQTLCHFMYTLCVPYVPFCIEVYTLPYRHISSHGFWPSSCATVAEYKKDFFRRMMSPNGQSVTDVSKEKRISVFLRNFRNRLSIDVTSCTRRRFLSNTTIKTSTLADCFDWTCQPTDSI